MNISQDFFLKNRFVIMNLARDLLAAEPGQKLQTIDYYMKQFSVSRGTVQMAMQYLIKKRCIFTQFRGFQGTFLLSKNEKKLWELSGIGTLTGAMPIPLLTPGSGLATGICDCMKAGNISFNWFFIYGSIVRLNSLIQGKCDFIIVTKLAQQAMRGKYNNVKVLMDLPGCSFDRKFILFFKDPRKTKVEDGMKVAFDPNSLDLIYLTKLVCKNRKNILYKETPSHFDAKLSVIHGESDVSVVEYKAATAQPGFNSHIKEIKIPEYPEYNKEDYKHLSAPVIMTLKDNYGLDAILKRNLHADIILNTQKGVINGIISPNYH